MTKVVTDSLVLSTGKWDDNCAGWQEIWILCKNFAFTSTISQRL